MVELDLFISEEMMTAPKHPLANNMERPLPDLQQGSRGEIRAIQQRDRIPGVVKCIIPLDNDRFWQYWWCVPGRLLLPEDVELLQRDRSRVEAIVTKLIWLWGGLCFGSETNRAQNYEPVYDWQQVLAFADQKGIKPDLLDIDFFPLAIKMDNSHSDSHLNPSTPSQVAVEPPHWHVEFFQLQPTAGGFELQELKNVCSCQIWTGKPFIKNLATGETITRYDLWVSRPLDLTIPPWQTSYTDKP